MLQRISLVIIAAAVLASCGKTDENDAPEPSVHETELLVNYLEANGNLLNSPAIPALIGAQDVYNQLIASNMHVIDLRTEKEFASGHILHSVNVTPDKILHYFEHRIDPASFDYIVLVCNNAKLSGFVNAILIFLGYDNVYAMRFGLSSWDKEIAEKNWLAAISDHLEGKLETKSNPKNPAGELPAIATGFTDGYNILRARAIDVLSTDVDTLSVTLEAFTSDTDGFYKIKYWPEAYYNQGHLPGAIQYTPKSSLHSNEYLHTLPPDQPIVISCYSGHHSAYATAFLRLLGYDAYNLPYGANSYIHTTLKTTQSDTRFFTEGHIHNFPLTGKDQVTPTPADAMKEEATPVIGGC
jgi:rhodanese-related sulfurtransferase